MANALNTGRENARGEFIARADADDLNRPYRFQKQIDFLEKNPEIQLLGGGFAPFNEKGHRLDYFHPTATAEIAWRFVSDTYFGHPTVMFRRRVFEAIGGYPSVEAEDFAYFSEVVKKYRCANLPIILVDYRESDSNKSRLNAEKVVASVRKKFLENFSYYVGDTRNAEIFFDFQNAKKLKIWNLSKVMGINARIISKIRANYGMSTADRDILRLHFVILGAYFMSITRIYFFIKRIYWGFRNLPAKLAAAKRQA